MLKTHIEEKHTERENAMFSCSLCDNVFNFKLYFMNHVRDSHSEIKEVCRFFSREGAAIQNLNAGQVTMKQAIQITSLNVILAEKMSAVKTS